jgi:hypothetical protein
MKRFIVECELEPKATKRPAIINPRRISLVVECKNERAARTAASEWLHDRMPDARCVNMHVIPVGKEREES